MADWPGWVGMATGVTGSVLAIISYRRAGKLKKLDLYVEAGRMANDLRQAYEQLTELHKGSLKARQNMAAATGMFNSGSMQKWESEWKADEIVIEELRSLIPDADSAYKSRNPEELATTIVIELDQTLQNVNVLVGKYREWAEWNEKKGEQLRADHRARRR